MRFGGIEAFLAILRGPARAPVGCDPTTQRRIKFCAAALEGQAQDGGAERRLDEVSIEGVVRHDAPQLEHDRLPPVGLDDPHRAAVGAFLHLAELRPVGSDREQPPALGRRLRARPHPEPSDLACHGGRGHAQLPTRRKN